MSSDRVELELELQARDKEVSSSHTQYCYSPSLLHQYQSVLELCFTLFEATHSLLADLSSGGGSPASSVLSHSTEGGVGWSGDLPRGAAGCEDLGTS